ncbi:MAG: hypothetical protein EXR79_16875 [Myxococcales bacterium]|nr:hypothetical protein [Myxococcales bacterium]
MVFRLPAWSIVVLSGALVACDVAPAAEVVRCNGSETLCGRRLDRVVFATAHNAMSNADEGWQLPNQTHGLARQLQDGVRGFLLDVYVYDGDDPKLADATTFCHGLCALGAEKASAGFAKFKTFLAANPGTVLVFVIEDHTDEARIEAALAESGLLPLCAKLDLALPMPTLGTLVAANTPVVVMTETGKGKAPWNHAYEKLAWDTPYAYKTKDDFTCQPLRGQKTNPLFVLNHFLTNPVAAKKYAEDVNRQEVLGPRAQKCWTESGRLPNLIAVDFVDVGAAVAVARELNGF